MRNPLFANFPLERLITNRNIKNKYKFEVRNNVVIDCYESHQASSLCPENHGSNVTYLPYELLQVKGMKIFYEVFERELSRL